MRSHEKRIRIAEQVRRHPERSNREIAKRLGVSHSTVAVVREELLAGGKIDYHTRPVLTPMAAIASCSNVRRSRESVSEPGVSQREHRGCPHESGLRGIR